MMEGDGRTDIGDPFKDSNSKFSSSLAVSLSINRRSFFSTEFVISSDMLDNSQLGLDLLPWSQPHMKADAEPEEDVSGIVGFMTPGRAPSAETKSQSR